MLGLNVEIHQTAIIADGAKIGNGVKIGPFCIVGENVSIGDNTVLKSNVVIDGKVSIGSDCLIHPFVIIGNQSHDLKFNADQATTTTIGNNCVIREFTNVHAGTPNSKRGTWIGNNVFLMSHCHVGHDCELFDDCLLSSGVTLGGEVFIYEKAIIGGCTAIHQFCSIGKYAIIGGCSKITQDVLPFMMSDGNPQSLDGINLIGLKRNNFDSDDMRIIKEIYKHFFISEQGLWAERLETGRELYLNTKVGGELFNFIDNLSRRIICKPKVRHSQSNEGEA